jgi:hypothetical protein
MTTTRTRPSNIVTYFGGLASAIEPGTADVHIFKDGDRETFCGLADPRRLTYGTPRTVGAPHRHLCLFCIAAAQ